MLYQEKKKEKRMFQQQWMLQYLTPAQKDRMHLLSSYLTFQKQPTAYQWFSHLLHTL